MIPFVQDSDFTLFVGDVRDVLAELQDESVDCVVTSPPYWRLRNYGVDGQLGLEPTPDLYVEAMVGVFREVRRVLAAHGTCFLNLGDSYASGKVGRHDQKVGKRADNADGAGNKGFGVARQQQRLFTRLKPKDLVGIPWRLAQALQEPYYTGRIRDERERIWLAATIEAEGCLFIHKRKVGQSNGQGYARKNDSYGAGLEVSSTDRVVVERCMAIAGIGSICEQTPTQNDRRKQTLYRWNVRSNECRWIIQELYPHLLAKKHEARLLLGCASSGDDARKAHESLKAIHQGQAACIDFREPEGMWERGWYLRSEIIWSKKPNPMPESVTDRPTKAHEQIFLLTKEPRYFFDQEAVREPATYFGPNGSASTMDGKNNSRPGEMKSRAGSKSPVRKRNSGGRTDGYTSVAGTAPAPPAGRNIRSVWEIATQPYAEAHFATYPEELVRRCLLAGCPEWVCGTCGKPRERVAEADSTWQERKANGAEQGAGWSLGGPRDGRSGTQRTVHGAGMSHDLTPKARRDLGWSDCGHNNYRPGIVLDPFMGSGTTALVARRHGRRSIGIELNPDYAALCAERLSQLSLLAEATP